MIFYFSYDLKRVTLSMLFVYFQGEIEITKYL